ncbi:MAG TPA: DUF4158 domain-containing protein [Chthoniobacterales bacterium]|nr:DUF4158 domain-containing protein [Chthoniobacterales bacterium]
MLSPSDTAYPLLRESPTGRELQELFTPNLSELGFAGENTRQPTPRLGLLLLLKSFQKLGYFLRLAEIPTPIVSHVAKAAGWNQIPDGLSAYDASTARFRHMALVRSYLGVTRFSDAARKLMLRFCLASSRVREDLADIVNMAIEELVLSLISKKEPLNSGSKISERFLDKIPLSFWSVVKNMRP